MTTNTLETAGADIVYDVRGPLPTSDGRPPLFMIGQPMDAGGFATLASHFLDRTVVTYDPRGLGRSVRKDGRVDNVPALQAADLLAQRRLGDVERLRRAREVPVPRDRDEVFELPEVHPRDPAGRDR